MAYWGYFVVGRGEQPLAELAALSGAEGGMTQRTSAPGGWQVWEYPSGEGEVGNMNALARETGAPALFGYVMNSECVVLEAAAPDSGAWTTCLARTAMAGYLGADREGLTLEDYFLEPRDAAERAVALGRRGRARSERRRAGGRTDFRPRSPGRKPLLPVPRPTGRGAPVTLRGRRTQ